MKKARIVRGRDPSGNTFHRLPAQLVNESHASVLRECLSFLVVALRGTGNMGEGNEKRFTCMIWQIEMGYKYTF